MEVSPERESESEGEGEGRRGEPEGRKDYARVCKPQQDQIRLTPFSKNSSPYCCLLRVVGADPSDTSLQ